MVLWKERSPLDSIELQKYFEAAWDNGLGIHSKTFWHFEKKKLTVCETNAAGYVLRLGFPILLEKAVGAQSKNKYDSIVAVMVYDEEAYGNRNWG